MANALSYEVEIRFFTATPAAAYPTGHAAPRAATCRSSTSPRPGGSPTGCGYA